MAASLGKTHFDCVKEWNVQDLCKNSAEPYRLQRQRGHRLVAELKPDAHLLDHITSNLADRHPQVEIRAISTRLYFEEYGLGAFEATFALTGDPSRPEHWATFLKDRDTWAEMDFFSPVIAGKLAIQRCWPDLRRAYGRAIEESGLTPFVELEQALARVVGQEIMENDDLLWTQCMDLVLFWNPDVGLSPDNIRANLPMLHEIGLTTDYTTNTARSEVSSGRVETLAVSTTAYAIASDTNMFVAMYSGFGMVALVSEPHPWRADGNPAGGFNMSTSPSRRIAALRRTLLMNYGAMTTATNILKQFLISSLTTSGRAGVELHEDLRRIIAALSIIKHEARRELIESDDVEAYAYKALYEMWSLPSQIDVLNETINDADKAASRLSESNIHEEERSFTVVLIVLTIAPIGGIASEIIGFVARPEEFNASLYDGAIRAGIVFGILCVTAAAAFRFGHLLHPHRRSARARRR